MKKLLFILSLSTFSACAFDEATLPDVIKIQPAVSIAQSGSTSLSYTSAPVDIRGRQGVGLFTLSCAQNYTNAVASKNISWTLEESSDGSTWYPVTNHSVGTLTAISNVSATQTNNPPGWTNQTFLFGAYTTATPASAGFAGSYFVQEPFTNSVYATNITTATKDWAFALQMNQLKRFARLNYTVGGSNNVYSLAGTIVAIPGKK